MQLEGPKQSKSSTAKEWHLCPAGATLHVLQQAKFISLKKTPNCLSSKRQQITKRIT